MASAVHPCLPFELFRRKESKSQPRMVDVAQKLSEDLDKLVAPSQSSPGEGNGNATEQPSLSAVAQDIQKQLRAVCQTFTSIADAADKLEKSSSNRPANGGGYSSSAGTGVGGENTPAIGTIPGSEEALAILSRLFALDVPTRLVTYLGSLEFEVRKDVLSLFSALVRLCPVLGADQQLADYALGHPKFFLLLVEGYNRPEEAIHCGVILRSCARHKKLVEAFFAQPDVFFKLVSFTRSDSFDISSDAFSSISDFMLTHKPLSAAFLEANFKSFFGNYNSLLQSESEYVTQRQALKLLSEMLLNRTFMKVMLTYVGDEQFLQIHMNLLRAKSKAIQCEAFHVFKIFVANPQKPPKVQQILYKNKEKLMALLEALKPGRNDDRQFMEDKNTVIEKLRVLQMPAKAVTTTAPSTRKDSLDSTVPKAASVPATENQQEPKAQSDGSGPTEAGQSNT